MNKARNIVLSIALIIGFMAAALSCASNSKPNETQVDFIGFITEIHSSQNKGISGQILVESHADKIVTKYTITIKSDTLIFKQEGDNLHTVAFTALESKQWVKIWFSGPVIESWPMQGTAKQVVIIE